MTALDPGLPDSTRGALPEMDQRAHCFHHRAISDLSQKRRRDRAHAGSCLHAEFGHRKAVQDGSLKGQKRHRPWPGSRLAERQQFRQPKIQVPGKAGGCQRHSGSGETVHGRASSSLSPAARNSSKRPKRSLRSTVLRSSTPKEASAAGLQSLSMAQRMSAAPRKPAGLIAKPMPPSPIEARARQPLRSGAPISKQAPLEARAGPPLERRHDKIHQVAFRRPCQGPLPKTGGAPCLAVQPANGAIRNSSRISLTTSSWSRLCLALC